MSEVRVHYPSVYVYISCRDTSIIQLPRKLADTSKFFTIKFILELASKSLQTILSEGGGALPGRLLRSKFIAMTPADRRCLEELRGPGRGGDEGFALPDIDKG